jgi:TraM recognition site of TraD and TraG
MDSKGDLINPIKNLQCIADRLLLIEPDEAFPLALNPLDIPKSHVAHTISLIEYIMSALLEAKFTSLQSTLFRNVIPAIIETIPDATLETFKTVITHGFKPYQEYFSKLDRRTQAFFLDKENGFHSKTYVDTRNQIVWRLDYLMTNPVMRAMFAASKTRLDLGKEMDAGKIIIINNSKALLTEEGAEFFGRFFIALILAAAQQRATKKPSQKLPCYVYIDECHNVIARDPKIPTILDECRSQKIALILAHQRTAQLTAPVLDAVSNCAIRMANSDDEAKYLADKLRTTTDFIRSLPRGTFAAFVRDLTRTALALNVPFVDMNDLPKMSAQQQAGIRARTRTEFGHAPVPDESPASLAEHYPALHRSKEPKPASESAAANVPKPPATPKTDPHTGDHTEPASKWGE